MKKLICEISPEERKRCNFYLKNSYNFQRKKLGKILGVKCSRISGGPIWAKMRGCACVCVCCGGRPFIIFRRILDAFIVF